MPRKRDIALAIWETDRRIRYSYTSFFVLPRVLGPLSGHTGFVVLKGSNGANGANGANGSLPAA